MFFSYFYSDWQGGVINFIDQFTKIVKIIAGTDVLMPLPNFASPLFFLLSPPPSLSFFTGFCGMFFFSPLSFFPLFNSMAQVWWLYGRRREEAIGKREEEVVKSCGNCDCCEMLWLLWCKTFFWFYYYHKKKSRRAYSIIYLEGYSRKA